MQSEERIWMLPLDLGSNPQSVYDLGYILWPQVFLSLKWRYYLLIVRIALDVVSSRFSLNICFFFFSPSLCSVPFPPSCVVEMSFSLCHRNFIVFCVSFVLSLNLLDWINLLILLMVLPIFLKVFLPNSDTLFPPLSTSSPSLRTYQVSPWSYLKCWCYKCAVS